MLGGYRIETRELMPGVMRINLSSRLTRGLGFPVSCYLVADVLIDTGFVKTAHLLLDFLRGRKLSAVACTHHHEDHAGACGLVAREHAVPVYLHLPQLRFSEGLSALRPYRLVYWGRPAPYHPQPMPAELKTRGANLQCFPTPGHSATHCVFFEPEKNILFSGDLLVAPGAAAILVYENPYQHIDSLRRAAALKPALMLSGHGLELKDPAPLLLAKAEAIEKAAQKATALHRQGRPPKSIVAEVFSNGWLRDRAYALLTGGEFSRMNFVRAAVSLQPHSARQTTEHDF
jgi:glyoxylase-like metal-dependent hydrolase (beta-lactamase superfamily II)